MARAKNLPLPAVKRSLFIVLCLLLGALLGGGFVWRFFSGEEAAGNRALASTAGSGISVLTEIGSLENSKNPSVHLDVPYLSQMPEYPTGCESISAMMLLEYWGVSLDTDDFIELYLERGELYEQDGVLYGPNPNDLFIGDPRSVNGYGCYAPVIQRALTRCLPQGYEVINETGKELSKLAETYLPEGIPLMIWVTIEMQEPAEGTQWIDESTGELFQWIAREHCVVLAGYDSENYYVNDPLDSEGVVSYPRELVESRFKQLGSQALAVVPSA